MSRENCVQLNASEANRAENRSEGNHLVTVVACYAFLSTLIGRTFTALIPTPLEGSDGPLFAYIASEWLKGHIPYLFTWTNKPPGIFITNAATFLLFPGNLKTLAVTEAFFFFGCVATVYLLMRSWGAPRVVAALAVALTAGAGNLLWFNQGGNLTEIYVLWPATLSIYLFSRAAPNYRGKWVFLAGFFAGVAALFKPIGIAALLAQTLLLFLLYISFRRLSARDLIISSTVSWAGAVSAWVPAFIYFYHYKALGEMLFASFGYNFEYVGSNWAQAPFWALLVAIPVLKPIGAAAIMGAVGLFEVVSKLTSAARARQWESKAFEPLIFWTLSLLWFFFDLAGALASGRGYRHYFLAMVPSLSVSAAMTFWHFTRGFPNDRRPGASLKLQYLLFLVVSGPILFSQAGDVWKLRLALVQPAVKTPAHITADYLNSVRQASDTLFVWNYLPEIYFLTGMSSSVRVLTALHTSLSPQGHERFGGEILRELNKQPPSYVVDATEDANSFAAQDSMYQGFRDFVVRHYSLVRAFGDVKIYKLADLPRK